MGTTVVGFRLGWDRKGRQATVVLTQAGVLHHGSGLLGMAPRPARPQAPAAPDPHPVPRQAATLRRVYAGLVHQGYGRELIPPVCIRLDTDERPLHPRPWGENAPRAHPELIPLSRSRPLRPRHARRRSDRLLRRDRPHPAGVHRRPAARPGRRPPGGPPGAGRARRRPHPRLPPGARHRLERHRDGGAPARRPGRRGPHPPRSGRTPGGPDGLAAPPAGPGHGSRRALTRIGRPAAPSPGTPSGTGRSLRTGAAVWFPGPAPLRTVAERIP
ncbi:predicted protein [Streptomyces sp. C]|nr:predicted protein [Streptomyces sp. C]